jgi:hypothetical protein
MKMYVGLLSAVIALATLLVLLGASTAAWLVGYVGTALVVFGTLVWIVIWDSRKRWPGTTWSTRLTKVLWFER